MLTLLPKRDTFRKKALAKAPTLVLGQTVDGFRYLLASPAGQQWRIESGGSLTIGLPGDEDTDPETEAQHDQVSLDSQDAWSELLSQPWNELSEKSIRNRRVVLCTQRPDVDFFNFPLVLEPGEDVTEAIYNELTLQEKVSVDDLAIDYQLQELEPERPLVFAASVARRTLDQWKQRASENNRRVEQVFLRPMAASHILDQVTLPALDDSCLLVAVYGQQADLILLHQQQPCFTRNLILQNPDSDKAIVEQLISEIRLSVSSLDLPYLDEALSNAVVLADQRLATELIVQLKVELDIDGTHIPIDQLPGFVFNDDCEPDYDWLPLLGSLNLETANPGTGVLDLMNPKQPVEPPSMVRRIVLLGALLIIVLGYFGMNLYDQYQADYDDVVKIVKDGRKQKASYEKILPDAQLAQYVLKWKGSEIQWLDQLQQLSETLPTGDQAVIRQMSGSQTPEGANMSLQIHARDLAVTESIQKAISEKSIQIKLKRVVETNDAQYPYRMETNLLAPRITDEESSTEESEQDSAS